MDEILVPIALFGFTAWAIVAVTRTISNNRGRRRMLEAKASPELVDALFAARPDSDVYSSLKWGIVAVAVAVALMILELLPFEADSPAAYGLVILAAGIALLVYYALAKRTAATGRPSATRREVIPQRSGATAIPESFGSAAEGGGRERVHGGSAAQQHDHTPEHE